MPDDTCPNCGSADVVVVSARARWDVLCRSCGQEWKMTDSELETSQLPHYVVVLLGARNPYDGEGGLRVVTADTPEEAVRKAHTNPPSTVAVKYAWVARLAEPYSPVLVPADVPQPTWGQPKAAR
jgi:hypothetical protein